MRVLKHAATLCALFTLAVGCQKTDVQQDERQTFRELEKEHAAWAARQPRPPLQIVRHIEAMLERNPCIGSLGRWSRSYAYNLHIPSRTLYRDIIDFNLEEAGSYGVKPGLHITEPNAGLTMDDRPIKMASGDYQVSNGKLTVGFCGPNVGPPPESNAIILYNDYFDDLEARQAKLDGTKAL